MAISTQSSLDPNKLPAHIVCPQCQLRQPLTLDCVGCGAIIDRFEPAVDEPQTPDPAPATAASSAAVQPTPDRLLGRPVGGGDHRAEAPSAEPGNGGVAGDLYRGANPFAEDGAHTRDRFRPYGTGPADSWQQSALELSSFSVFGEAVGLVSRNLFGFLLIAGVTMLPALLVWVTTLTKLTMAAGTDPVVIKGLLVLSVLGLLAIFLSIPLATAAITFGVGRELRGEKTTVIDCVQGGLKVLLPVLWVTVAQTMIVGAVGLIASVAVFGMLKLGMFLGLFGILGIALLMSYLAAGFAVTVPATLEERPGIFGALNRSWELTTGARWSIVWFYFLIAVTATVIGAVLAHLTGMVNEGVGVVGGLLVNVLACATTATGVAVFYFRLRSITERLPIAKLPSMVSPVVA